MPGQVSDFAGDGNPESAEIELKNRLHRAAFGLVVRALRTGAAHRRLTHHRSTGRRSPPLREL